MSVHKLDIILVDHFDSFTFNLVDLFAQTTHNITVVRSDINITQLKQILYKCKNPVLVLSPGPGAPEQATTSIEMVQQFYPFVPILGICLGHQIIAHALGGKVTLAELPVHGKVASIKHSGKDIFNDLPNPLTIGRYHSLMVEQMPTEFEAVAMYDDMLMAMKHKTYPSIGLQFHPESILTQCGGIIVSNFLKIAMKHYTEIMLKECRYA